jgi:ribosome-binding factor A
MSQRVKKVNELIKREISKIIEREIDPELGFLTVTEVCTTSDLRLADVWISIYNKKTENFKKVLEEITPTIQKILNKRLYLKYVPKITLKIDTSTAYAFEIDKTLNKIKNNK